MFLRVTAYLINSIAVSDDWSPSLDSLIDLSVLQKEATHLVCPNPSLEQIKESEKYYEKYHPIAKTEFEGEVFRACSSPYYLFQAEDTTRYRKRWDYQEKHLDWGKKKAKFSTSEGHTKSYDLPLYLRVVNSIDWFCIGDLQTLKQYLSFIRYLGKKRSYGYGQIEKWEVKEFTQDWSLFKDGLITRPIPFRLVQNQPFHGNTIMRWGWRSPYWLPENQDICLMPKNNCKVL